MSVTSDAIKAKIKNQMQPQSVASTANPVRAKLDKAKADYATAESAGDYMGRIQAASNADSARSEAGQTMQNKGLISGLIAERKNKISASGGADTDNYSGYTSIYDTPAKKVNPLRQTSIQSPNFMSQQDFVSAKTNVAKAGATATYDKSVADLKTRIAGILAKNAYDKGKLDDTYVPVFENNEQGRYDSAKQIQSILARRGLQNSGVDVGNTLQNTSIYDTKRNAIGLEKSGKQADYAFADNQALAEQDRTMEALSNQRNNESNMAEAKAYDEWLQYATDAEKFKYGISKDTRDYNLQSYQVNADVQNKADTLALQKQANETDAQYKDRMMNLESQKNAYDVMDGNRKFGLEEKKVTIQEQQFTQTMANETRKLDQIDTKMAQEYELGKEQLANAIKVANIGASSRGGGSAGDSLAREKFEFEKADYYKELEQNGGMSQSYIKNLNEKINTANKNIDTMIKNGYKDKIVDYMDEQKDIPNSAKQAILKQVAAVHGIPLPRYWEAYDYK